MSRLHTTVDVSTDPPTIATFPFTPAEETAQDAAEAAAVDFPTIDGATLNAALAQPGSVVRALGLVMFAEINKLRVAGGSTAYTMPQFVTALKAQMR